MWMNSSWSKSWIFGRKKVLIYQAECMWTMRLGQYRVCFCKCLKCWPMSKLNGRWNKNFSLHWVILCNVRNEQRWFAKKWFIELWIEECIKLKAWPGLAQQTIPIEGGELFSYLRYLASLMVEPEKVKLYWTNQWESCLSDSSGCMMIRRVCFYLGQKPAWSCCPYASHNPCCCFSSQHRDCKSSSAGEAPFPFNF